MTVFDPVTENLFITASTLDFNFDALCQTGLRILPDEQGRGYSILSLRIER
jgi:hypothetical protein